MVPNNASFSDLTDKVLEKKTPFQILKYGLLIGALGVAGFFALANLPIVLGWVAAVLASTLKIVITGGVLLVIGYLLSDERFRNLLSYGYRAFLRVLTQWVVDLSPISVLQDYVSELKASLQKMDVQIKSLTKQIADLDRVISVNKDERESNLAMASRAKKDGKHTMVQLKGRLAARLGKSIMTLDQLRKKMDMVKRILQKMREACDISIQDTEENVRITIREHTALMAGSIAVSEAIKIINGDPNKKQVFDMAMGKLARDTAHAVGEIEDFMERSQAFFDSIDLQNGMFDEKAYKMLEEWEQKAESAVLGPGGKQALLNATSDGIPFDLNEQVVEPVRIGDINDYFKS